MQKEETQSSSQRDWSHVLKFARVYGPTCVGSNVSSRTLYKCHIGNEASKYARMVCIMSAYFACNKAVLHVVCSPCMITTVMTSPTLLLLPAATALFDRPYTYIENENYIPSVTSQHKALASAVELMDGLVMEQLRSDGLAADPIVQHLLADVKGSSQLSEHAAQDSGSTASATPGSQAEYRTEQAHIVLANQSYVWPFLIQAIQPWPQPSSKQWASIVTIANRINMLHTWLISPVQQSQIDSKHSMQAHQCLIHSNIHLLANLITGVLLSLPDNPEWITILSESKTQCCCWCESHNFCLPKY